MKIRTTLHEKFLSRVDASAECWIWTGYSTPDGYGAFTFWSHGKAVTKKAHRLAYEFAYGEIPAALQIDHLCRNRLCCRPEHLEAVGALTNLARRGEKSINQSKLGL